MADETTTQHIETPPFARPIADLSRHEKRALLAQLLRRKASASPPFHPLSDNQQGIWFLCQLAPENSIYNVSFAERIRAEIDIPAFRRAFQALVDRHPSLRTTIAVHSGKPVQQIHDRQTVHFEETDASTWGEDELQTRLIGETQRPFDLERGPVMRVGLFARSAQEHIFLLVIHHIVVDFWSLAVMMNELGVLYSAETAGRPASLPPLDLHYTDFVRWQADMLAGPAGERLWDYWKKQLAGPLPVLDLPTDRPRPPIQMFRGAQHDFTLDDELAERLRALAKAEGATLYMVLLAAFEVLLHVHTGQDDILVASPMVGRSRAEFEGLAARLHWARRASSSALRPVNPATAPTLAATVLQVSAPKVFEVVALATQVSDWQSKIAPPAMNFTGWATGACNFTVTGSAARAAVADREKTAAQAAARVWSFMESPPAGSRR